MLINSNKLLKNAKKNKKVIFHFNINNLEWTKAILEECNKLKTDVILGVSESAVDYMGGYNVVFSIVSSLMKSLNIKINVVLHLDHGKSFESCKKAIDSGFTSVMIDGSKLEFQKNIELTKKVVKYAHERNISVEAELGVMGLINKNDLTFGINVNLDDAKKFVKETKIDSFAPAVGTVHGICKKVNIDFNLIKKLANNIDIPLVLHGGSGLANDILKKCVDNGITKININSDLQEKWSKNVRCFTKKNQNVIDPRQIIMSGIPALKNEIDFKMNINN